MPTRRRFLASLGGPAAAAGVMTAVPIRWNTAIAAARELSDTPGSAEDIAADEEFWFEIQKAFTIDRSLVNLNNGGVSPTPAHVLEAMKRDLDFANQLPVYNGWQILEPQREGIRQRLARQWDVDAEEVAITRNASESLQILQNGYDLERGDEVVTTTQDYGRMVTTFKQRERRHGIVLKQFSIPIPAEDPAEVVRRFEEQLTERTRLILMCHMINITGQILPVRDVVEMARPRGIPVIVDGAHSMAHHDFTISELGCDNYSVSLHKWLHAPIGTGLLYVKREEIPNIWPLQAAPETRDDDIRKFEETGTHPEANFLAIGEALTFHQLIGGKRKEERLVYLRNHWAKQLLEHDRVHLNTSLEPGFAAGIANVQIVGIDTSALRNWLWDEHKIFTVAINHDEFTGLRISPSTYTTLEELDRFVDAMTHAVEHGIPT
ncbi:MAG: aminotransferase class V-fold PLP-dependent enzyme [Gemmatimonadetes bacterium]|nr:aminotransferase class V-fold PLP-dependent enzyme [Gemmatimonadota bacterium]